MHSAVYKHTEDTEGLPEEMVRSDIELPIISLSRG